MKKKIIATILALVLVLALACPGVGACGLSGRRQPAYVNSSSARFAAAEKLVSDCNRSVELMVYAAQRTPYYDVPVLVYSVNRLIATTVALVNAMGFETECTYTEYVVDGCTVLIDPLRVINPIEGGGGNGGNGGNGGK